MKSLSLATLVHKTSLFSLLLAVCLLSRLYSQEIEMKETVEVFNVSKVGSPNATETREQLIKLYQSIKEQYDAEIASAEIPAFKGTQVRIIKAHDESVPGSIVYIIAYQGGFALARIESDAVFESGDLTPPLIIADDGEQEVEVERRVLIESKEDGDQSKKPEKKEGGSFFGIPVNDSSERGTYQLIKENKRLKRYRASISSEKLDDTPTELSKEMFLSQIKNGKVFLVTQTETRRCVGCNGWGRVFPKHRDSNDQMTLDLPTKSARKGARRGANVKIKPENKAPESRDGKVDCPNCPAASGKNQWKVTYQVGW